MAKKREPPSNVSPKLAWQGEQVRFVKPLSERKKKDVIRTKQTNGKQEVDTTLRAASSRLPMWINRYRDVVNTAKLMAGEDVKLVWRIGPTKEHCRSCSRLNGKVKRKSQWIASGIRPQSPQLECHGFNCLCTLNPTSEPASRGPLPRIP